MKEGIMNYELLQRKREIGYPLPIINYHFLFLYRIIFILYILFSDFY